MENFEALKEMYKDGMLLFISQNGCGGCEQVRGLIAETVKDKIPVVEAGIEDLDCANVAEHLGVGVTPTVIFFKDKEEKARIAADGKLTADDIRAKLRELVPP